MPRRAPSGPTGAASAAPAQRENRLKSILDALVAKGVITQTQEDAIVAALKAENKDHPDMREFVGDVVHIPFKHPTQIQHIGGGRLPFPGGIAQGGDGAMYVTIWSAGTEAAIGAVVRVSSPED